MSQMKVIDKGGEWFMNTAAYRFVDAETGNIFEPGLPTKVKKNAWIEGQPMIVACPDPLSDEPMPEVIKAADSTLVPINTDTGLPAANAAPGIAGTAAAKTSAKK